MTRKFYQLSIKQAMQRHDTIQRIPLYEQGYPPEQRSFSNEVTIFTCGCFQSRTLQPAVHRALNCEASSV